MLLTVECLDQDTLCWRTLARHEGVTPESAPMIVSVLRDGLPASSVLRWNWSGRSATPPAAPSADAAPRPRRRFPRRGRAAAAPFWSESGTGLAVETVTDGW